MPTRISDVIRVLPTRQIRGNSGSRISGLMRKHLPSPLGWNISNRRPPDPSGRASQHPPLWRSVTSSREPDAHPPFLWFILEITPSPTPTPPPLMHKPMCTCLRARRGRHTHTHSLAFLITTRPHSAFQLIPKRQTDGRNILGQLRREARGRWRTSLSLPVGALLPPTFAEPCGDRWPSRAPGGRGRALRLWGGRGCRRLPARSPGDPAHGAAHWPTR